VFTRESLIQAYQLADRSTPLVRLNFIASLDGAATHEGLSGGLNNADDKLVFDTLRMLSDVIVVGAGTVRAEGYGGIRLPTEHARWRLDQGLAAQPPLAVVSASLDLDPEHPLFTEAATRPLVVTHAASPDAKRRALAEVSDVLVCGADALDVRLMVRALADRGLKQILCEGGPTLFGALLEADAVDELCLSLSPVLESGSAGRIARGAPVSRAMSLQNVVTAGDMVFLRYGRGPDGPDRTPA